MKHLLLYQVQDTTYSHNLVPSNVRPGLQNRTVTVFPGSSEGLDKAVKSIRQGYVAYLIISNALDWFAPEEILIFCQNQVQLGIAKQVHGIIKDKKNLSSFNSPPARISA